MKNKLKELEEQLIKAEALAFNLMMKKQLTEQQLAQTINQINSYKQQIQQNAESKIKEKRKDK